MTTPEQLALHEQLANIGPWKGVKQIVASVSDHELLTEPVDPSQPQSDLINHNGRVIGKEGRVVLVYLDQFQFDEAAFTLFMKNIVEQGFYKDPQGVQSDCTFVGASHISPSGLSGQIMDADFQKFIFNHLGHEIPAADGNTYYCFILPAGVTAAFPSGNNVAACCSDFCGYHSNFAVNGNGAMVYYGVICSPDCQGCYGSYPPYGGLTVVTSHEHIEWRSDPEGSGWYDAQGNENADKCAWPNPGIRWGPANDFINPGWQNGQAAGAGCGTGFGDYRAPTPAKKLTASIAASKTTVNVGDLVSFSVSVSGQGPSDSLSFAYNFGDGGTTVGGPSTNYVFHVAGTFVVTVTVDDSDGRSAQSVVTVVVAAAVQPPPVTGGAFTPAPSKPLGRLLLSWLGNLALCAADSAVLAPALKEAVGATTLQGFLSLSATECLELSVMTNYLKGAPSALQSMLNDQSTGGYGWGAFFVAQGWIDKAS